MLIALALFVMASARALRGRRWSDRHGPDSYRQALRKLGQVADQQQDSEPPAESQPAAPNDHDGSDDSTERVTILGPVTPSSRAAQRREASSAKARTTRRTSRPPRNRATPVSPPSDADDAPSGSGDGQKIVIPAPTSPGASTLRPPDVPTPPPLPEPRESRRERKKQERAEAAAAKAVAAMAEAAAAARAAATTDADASPKPDTGRPPPTRDPAPPPTRPEPARTRAPTPEPAAGRTTPDPTGPGATPAPTTTGGVRQEPVAPSAAASYSTGERRHRPAWALAVAVTTAVIIAGIVGLIVSNSNHGGGSNNAAVTSAPHHRPSTGSTASTISPPTTVALVRPTSTTGDTATFSLTQPTTFAVLAGADCWIRIVSGSGQQLFEGTLHNGDGHQWSITAPAGVRLGNAGAVLMRLGGHGLALPQLPAGMPYNLQFNASP